MKKGLLKILIVAMLSLIICVCAVACVDNTTNGGNNGSDNGNNGNGGEGEVKPPQPEIDYTITEEEYKQISENWFMQDVHFVMDTKGLGDNKEIDFVSNLDCVIDDYNVKTIYDYQSEGNNQYLEKYDTRIDNSIYSYSRESEDGIFNKTINVVSPTMSKKEIFYEYYSYQGNMAQIEFFMKQYNQFSDLKFENNQYTYYINKDGVEMQIKYKFESKKIVSLYCYMYNSNYNYGSDILVTFEYGDFTVSMPNIE